MLSALTACSLPVLADAEVEACKAQIRATTNHDLAGEELAGWNINITNGRRAATIVFAGTAEHPKYVCSVVDEVVTGLVEERVIYPAPDQTKA
jgi:hypothetical protein